MVTETSEDGKVCSRCKTWKNRAAYNRQSCGPFGMRSSCRECQHADEKATNRRWYKAHPRTESVISTTNTDAAWAAGLFDGEGCVQIVGRNPIGKQKLPSLRVVLSLGMIHEATVRRLHNLLGVGHVIVVKPKTERYRVQYRWVCSALIGKAVLTVLYPYLITKRAEADVAFQFYNLGGMDQRRFPDVLRQRLELRDRLQALKRLPYGPAPTEAGTP